MGVACQQGTLTLPDTWLRPQLWDLLVLQLLRPDSSTLPYLYSTFHLEYPLVLSRFCFQNFASNKLSKIWNLIAGKLKPAISFQNFESKSHEKNRQLAFKFLPAICVQKLSSDLLWRLFQWFAFKTLKANRWKKKFQLAFKFLKATWKLFWAEKTKMADIKAIIVIMRLIKNTSCIFLEELKYSIFLLLFTSISNILVLLRVSELWLDFINYTSLGTCWFCERVFGKPGYTVTVGSF